MNVLNMPVLTIYLIIINIIGFVYIGRDKALAKANRRRIPEKTLFAVSLIGGSAGSWAGMYIFHHKIKHMAFVLGIPVMLLLQLAILIKMLTSYY